MNLFDLSAKLSLDSSDYEEGISAAQRGVQALEGAVKLFVFGKAAQAFLGFAKDAVSTGMAFDSAMSQVAATMGVSADEIGNLRDFAKEMGATTKFSAVEAAQALNYMALAGYDAEKSMETLPTVLNLASAGGMDLARASDMVTDAESALGLTSEQTAAMVDQMARTASKSNTSVEQLGDAMLTIGGTARFMAGGTDRLQTVLGLLADNGIKGSEAGTHLRNMLLKLSSPTENGAKLIEELGLNIFDAEGNMRDMQDIMLDLNGAMSNLTQEDRVKALSELFNARDLSAVNALLGTSKERWDELGASIAEASGSAEQMAGTQLGNLTGDITIMKSALEGVKIEFAEGITPALRDVVQRITRALSNPKTQKFLRNVGESLGKVISYLTDLVSRVLLPKAISLFEDGGKKLKTFGAVAAGLAVTIKTVTTVMGLLAGTVSPTGLLLKGIGLLIGALSAAGIAADGYYTSMYYLNDEQKKLVDKADEVHDSIASSEEAFGESAKAIMGEKQATEDLWKELQNLVTEDGHVLEGNEKRVDFILGELNNALGLELTRNGDLIVSNGEVEQSYSDISKEIDNLIQKRAAEALLDARKDLYVDALQNRVSAMTTAGQLYNELQTAQEDYNTAVEAEKGFWEANQAAFDEADESGRDAILNKAKQFEDARIQAEKSVETLSEKYDQAQSDAETYYKIVSDYENAQADIIDENYNAAIGYLNNENSKSLEYYRNRSSLSASEQKEFEDAIAEKEALLEQYKRSYARNAEGITKEMIDQLQKEVDESKRVATQGGKDFGSGYATGIGSMLDTVTSAARNMVTNAINAARNAQDSHSPSRVMRKEGRNAGLGYGLGIEDEYGFVDGKAGGLVDIASNALETTPAVFSSGAGSGSGGLSEVVGVLKAIKETIPRSIVLDSGVIAGSVDKALGQITMRKARGNA